MTNIELSAGSKSECTAQVLTRIKHAKRQASDGDKIHIEKFYG